jgi:PIN domain nuclease of toxin-antitoxin system
LKAVLDTHMWVWWLLADSPLPDRERRALDRLAASRDLCLPAICQWEAQMLHARGRITLPLPFATWLRRATSGDVLSVLPITADVIAAVDELPAAFHGDPADRLIVATARIHELPLATHDASIRKSGLVRIWKR